MSKRRLTSQGSWIPSGNQNALLVESDVLDSWNSIGQSEGLTSDTSIIKFLISLYSHGQRSQHKKVVDVLCAGCHNNLYCISCQHKPSVPSPSSSASARRATPKHPRQSSLRTETVTSQDIHADSESVAVAAALEAVASQGIIPHGVISQGVKFPQGAILETLASQNVSVVASETYPNETPNTAGKRRTSRVESGAVSMPSVQSRDSYYPSGTDSTTNPTTSASNVVWQTDNMTVKTEVDSEGEADDGECDFEAYPDGQSSQSSSMLAPVRMEPGKEEVGGGGDGDGLNSFREEEGSSLTAGEDGVAVAGSSNADAGCVTWFSKFGDCGSLSRTSGPPKGPTSFHLPLTFEDLQDTEKLRAYAADANPNKKRIALTLSQRVGVINRHKSGESVRSIARSMGVGKTQIQSIMKNEPKIMERWNAGFSGDTKKFKKSVTRYEDVNAKLYQWYLEAKSLSVPVTGKLLQDRALAFAPELGHSNFQASNGWLQSWCIRHHVSLASERASMINSWKLGTGPTPTPQAPDTAQQEKPETKDRPGTRRSSRTGAVKAQGNTHETGSSQSSSHPPLSSVKSEPLVYIDNDV